MQKIKNYFYQPAQLIHYAGALVLMLAVTGLTMRASVKDFSRAASPTFTMTQSGDMVNLIADGTVEGQGLLGAETNITYDSKLVEIKLVDFGTCAFDYCMDLSTAGQLKLIAASAFPSAGGKALTQQQTFAKISLNFLGKDPVKFDFSKCQVINENNAVEDRTCNGVVATPGSTATVAVCGNNKVENGEQCDDGNTKDGDGCSATCIVEVKAVPVCGNSKVETGEQCDDGNMINGDGCSATCSQEVANPVCGNSVVENNEQCDDGNVKDGDGCSAKCTTEVIVVVPVCGNSQLEGTEECDDGNANNGDGCSAQCTNESTSQTRPVCGNNKVENGEQCDDGNVNDGDGCSAACSVETPPVKKLVSVKAGVWSGGSSTFSVGESMALNAWAYFSDSNQAENITSKATYTSNAPSVAQANGSTVKGLSPGSATVKASYTYEGITESDRIALTILASSIKAVPVCGDAKLEGTEECDDGNVINGDGCSAQCTNESTSQTRPVCGNNKVEGAEQCDDGNTSDGDGCSAACTTEKQSDQNSNDQNNGRTKQQEITPDELHPVAPAPAEVAKAAENVIRTQDVVRHAAVVIQAPKKQEVVPKLDLCRNQYPKLDFDSSADADGDGLSNKTECYLGTNPSLYDTDHDTCSDGSEINELGTNPLNGSDCGQPQKETPVTITDPHAGWILRHLEVAGFAPVNTASVTAMVFPAEGKAVKTLTEDLKKLTAQTDPQSLRSAADQLIGSSIPAVEAFLVENASGYNYDNLTQVVTNLKSELATLDPTAKTIPDSLALSLEQLQVLSKDKITAGTVNQLSDADLSGKAARKFEITTTEPLDSNKIYDLVAVATLKDGSTRASAPVRFGLDASERVKKPEPRSIGNQSISQKPTAFSNIWIGNVRADSIKDGVEVQIDQTKPTVSGDSEFGSQVFAVWNSVVLASSVISDSEQGAFSVQAPKNLETDIGHRVTLYAVKANDNGQEARSDSVNVFFRIKPVAIGFSGALWGLAGLAALGLATVLVRRRLTRGAPMVTPEKAAAVYTGATPIEQELDAAFKAIEPDPTPVRELTPQETAYFEHVEDQAIEQEMKEEEKTHHA